MTPKETGSTERHGETEKTAPPGRARESAPPGVEAVRRGERSSRRCGRTMTAYEAASDTPAECACGAGNADGTGPSGLDSRNFRDAVEGGAGMSSGGPSGEARLPSFEGCDPACLGCLAGRLSSAALEERKVARARRALAPWAALLAPLVTAPPERQLAYRDRVDLAARHDPKAGWRFGMEGTADRRDAHRRADGSRARPFVSLMDCPLHSRRGRAVLRLLGDALSAADPEGALPLAFVVLSGGQATLVLKSARDPGDAALGLPRLRDFLAAAGGDGLWLHLHPAAGVRLFAKSGWRLLWGTPRSRDARGLRHGPTAFAQLLPELHDASLAAAADFLRPEPGDRVADLYCGIGASLALWRARGAEALGVETSREALDCAAKNAPGTTLLRGTCAARLPQIRPWLEEVPPDRRLVYANPPRSGLEPGLAEGLAACRPQRMAYLACSPGTLARDLRLFEALGFGVARLLPYDFFPRTDAVEVLALLER